ncbi:hypothetical protein BX616_006958, partial [Lobosporangium transversale]
SSKSLRRENGPNRSMSAPSGNKTATTNNQPWLQQQMTDEPSLMMEDPAPLSNELQDSVMIPDTNLFGDQATTFGLSDDDIMSSFTTFTAKLGDSLAKSPAATLYAQQYFGGNTPESMMERPKMHVQTSVPSLSPPSLERSPTTSSDSMSPSPWIPWMSLEQSLLGNSQDQQQQQQQPPIFVNEPTTSQQNNSMTISLQQVYPSGMGMGVGMQPGFSAQSMTEPQMIYPQDMFAAPISAVVSPNKIQQQQSDTWNQYMQYLLYQQQGLAFTSDPQQAQQQQQQGQFAAGQQAYLEQSQMGSQPYPLRDPHWQATMMTMMMNPNPALYSVNNGL